MPSKPLSVPLTVPSRLLIGPLYNPGVIGGYLHHPDIRTFMAGPIDPAVHDLSYESGEDFAALLARLDGWEPDLVIWWDLIYQALPPGIADCPYPTAVIVGDWNLHFFAVEHYVQAFDYVFGDRQLIELLTRMGHRNCRYWPGFSFEPAKHHLIPGLLPSWDISFVGNLNHLVQRQRGAYLERIARLSERWRVRIAGGVHGEAYTRLLAGSRIVFNHSIRGEMNMRAYEAPACGALLMMEASNLEVRDFLTPGRECVLYEDDNLEALIEYYLSHEAERAAIAAAGHARIQAFSYERQFGHLLGLLPDVLGAFAGPGARGFHSLSPLQQTLVSVRQLYRANTPGSIQAAVARLADTADFGADAAGQAPELLNQMGKFLFELALDQLKHDQAAVRALAPASLNEAMRLFRVARVQAALEPIPAYNLACCYDLGQNLNQDPHAALALYAETLDLLALPGAGLNPWYDPVLPMGYGQRFGIEWDRRQAAAVTAGDPERSACRELLAWQIHERRGILLLAQARFAEAEAAWRAALELCPEFGETEAYLGHAQLAQGRRLEAIQSLSRAIAKQPFMLGLWNNLARLQIAQGDFAGAVALLAPRMPVLKVNEGLASEAPQLTHLLRLARLGHSLVSRGRAPLELLSGPFSIPLYQQLCAWAEDFDPSPQLASLTVALNVVWQPRFSEPLCLFPPESGVSFVVEAAAPDAFSLMISAAPADPPRTYRRVYAQASELDAGLIGPDRLPFLFPSLLSEVVELEDQRAFNLLLVADRLDAPTVLEQVRAFCEAFALSSDVALLLWKPDGDADSTELAALESVLEQSPGGAEAQVALVPSGLSSNQQGMLLQSMQLVLGDPRHDSLYFLVWALSLGIPVRLLSRLTMALFPADLDFCELVELTGGDDQPISHSTGEAKASEALLALSRYYAFHQARALELAAVVQIYYRERVAQQILDLCWELRLRF